MEYINHTAKIITTTDSTPVIIATVIAIPANAALVGCSDGVSMMTNLSVYEGIKTPSSLG